MVEEPSTPLNHGIVAPPGGSGKAAWPGRRELVVASTQETPSGRKNQDRVFAFTALVPNGDSAIPVALLVIADGISGTDDGGRASDIAIGVVGEYVLRHVLVPTITLRGISSRHGSIREVLAEAMKEANRQVFESGRSEGVSLGTTLTALLVVGASAHLAHVGDCRAYVVEATGARQISVDHSLGARLASIGQGDASSGSRNVLYRALGAGAQMDAQVLSFQLDGTAGFILCSDGLWSALDEPAFQLVARTPARARAVCDALFAAVPALADDASAIVAMFE